MGDPDESEKTIKQIMIKIILVAGFILLVPGMMSSVLEIDLLDKGCIKVEKQDVQPEGVGVTQDDVDNDVCWRQIESDDQITKAKIAFDRDVISLIMWGVTIFTAGMLLVGIIFPGRDIMSYIRSNKAPV